ncbi:nuclear transport factor 2 family protein [Nocardia brevicatena]|uniref:nuclear transport factor 2 family protein n=1 Tax=Nocardia brevicatena TaxID=37327 RepID=UPI000315CD88|nr:nuclear transport factor 2 family protein [Nocardia brevicatena]
MTLDRLKQFAAAWRDKDLDALMSFMAPDCVFNASVGIEPGTTFEGHDQVRRGFELMAAYDSSTDTRLGLVLVCGSHGVVQWRHTRADGTHTEGCDIYEFRGDLIRVKDAYRKVNAVLVNAPSDHNHRE